MAGWQQRTLEVAQHGRELVRVLLVFLAVLGKLRPRRGSLLCALPHAALRLGQLLLRLAHLIRARLRVAAPRRVVFPLPEASRAGGPAMSK